jgi:hypothetical protein
VLHNPVPAYEVGGDAGVVVDGKLVTADLFEENPPCLPCGVHMYLGNGRVLETRHSPMFGLQVPA